MLKRANEAGLNMVITHEDTFWNDRDDTKDLTANAHYKLKTEYILKNDMVVWRDHDHMHAMTPDYTVVGELRSAGIKAPEPVTMRPGILTIPRRRTCIALRGRSQGEGEQNPHRHWIRDPAHDA